MIQMLRGNFGRRAIGLNADSAASRVQLLDVAAKITRRATNIQQYARRMGQHIEQLRIEMLLVGCRRRIFNI